jgi:acetolactate synthase-1/2/3 large subunit
MPTKNKVVDMSIPIVGDVVSSLAALIQLIRSSPHVGWFEGER